jgi:broad specificity phosphatase PhoE
MDSTVDVGLVMDSTIDVGLMMAGNNSENDDEERLDTVEEGEEGATKDSIGLKPTGVTFAPPEAPEAPAHKTGDHFVIHIQRAMNLPGHYEATNVDPVVEFRLTDESGIEKGIFSSLPRHSTKNPVWDCYRDLLLDKPVNHDQSRSLMDEEEDDSDEEGEFNEEFKKLMENPEQTQEVRRFYEENDDWTPERVHKEKLIAFYKTHNPGKLARVDEFLFQYQGKEREMFNRLEDKYIAKLNREAMDAKYGQDKKKSSARPSTKPQAIHRASDVPAVAEQAQLAGSRLSVSPVLASPVSKSSLRGSFAQSEARKRNLAGRRLKNTDRLYITVYDAHEERHQNRIDGNHTKAWKLAETEITLKDLRSKQERAGKGQSFTVKLSANKPEWSAVGTVKKTTKMLRTMLLGGEDEESQIARLSSVSSASVLGGREERNGRQRADGEADDVDLVLRLLDTSTQEEEQMEEPSCAGGASDAGKKHSRTRRKTVYFVRHGQSTWNKAKAENDVRSLMMTMDHPLTMKGAHQAIVMNQAWHNEKRKKTRRDKRNVAKAEKAAKAGKAVDSEAAEVDVSGMVMRSGKRSARHEEMVDGFFDAQLVLVSPLARAVQTALLAMRGHPATLLPAGGYRLSRTIREFKKSVAGYDCVSDKLADAPDKLDLVGCAVNDLNELLKTEAAQRINSAIRLQRGNITVENNDGGNIAGAGGVQAMGTATIAMMDSTMDVGLLMAEDGEDMDASGGAVHVSTDPCVTCCEGKVEDELGLLGNDDVDEMLNKAQGSLPDRAFEDLQQNVHELRLFELEGAEGPRRQVEENDARTKWWTDSGKRDSSESLLHRMDDFVFALRYCEEHKIVVVGHSNFFFKFCRLYLGEDSDFRKNNPEYADELLCRKLDNGACLAVELEFAEGNTGCTISHAELLFDSKLKGGKPKKKKEERRSTRKSKNPEA